MKTPTRKVISKSATIYNADGMIQAQGLRITDQGDTIVIGSTEHNKAELEITDKTVTSKISGWSVIL